MVERGGANNRGQCSSLHLPLLRTHRDVIRSVETYYAQTHPPTKDALEALEEEARQAREGTPDSEVDAEMLAWIPYIGSSISREMKYYRTIDLYCT